MPLVPVRALTTFTTGDATHRLLRGYKDAPVDEARRSAVRSLRALLAARWTALAAGTVVVTVPSSRRPGPPPSARLVGGLPVRVVDVLGRGEGALDHLRASRTGFRVDGPVPAGLGERPVVVFDDCLVTGARAQSAAAALRLAGIPVSGIVVVGRTVVAGSGRCVA
jgi:hypothetical protein